MAQNISLKGKVFSNVPAVNLPKDGGGKAKFVDSSDATATAADILAGETAYVNGVKITGTGSGGASNYVSGEFTVGSTGGTTEVVDIPYTGSGYPIACLISVKGGAYNSSNTTWYNSTKRYAVGHWAMTKSTNAAATWQSSGAANQGVISAIYKNSTSSGTTYSRSSAMNVNVLSTSSANPSASSCYGIVKFRSAKKIAYATANGTSSTYGFLSGVTYEYHIIYSS